MKAPYEYDIHLATEAGDSEYVEARLKELGFTDDNLAERGLIFDPETAQHYTTCPLIVVHVSKKTQDYTTLRHLESDVDRVMVESGATGYWHSECTLEDIRLESRQSFLLKSLPFARLTSRPRDTKKVWDIHLAIQEGHLPQALKDVLIENGIYYLSRWKRGASGTRERFAVFTVQGINHIQEGRRFYAELSNWLIAIGAPPSTMKLELTTAMQLYNSPSAVPPTIETVSWL